MKDRNKRHVHVGFDILVTRLVKFGFDTPEYIIFDILKRKALKKFSICQVFEADIDPFPAL